MEVAIDADGSRMDDAVLAMKNARWRNADAPAAPEKCAEMALAS